MQAVSLIYASRSGLDVDFFSPEFWSGLAGYGYVGVFAASLPGSLIKAAAAVALSSTVTPPAGSTAMCSLGRRSASPIYHQGPRQLNPR